MYVSYIKSLVTRNFRVSLKSLEIFEFQRSSARPPLAFQNTLDRTLLFFPCSTTFEIQKRLPNRYSQNAAQCGPRPFCAVPQTRAAWLCLRPTVKICIFVPDKVTKVVSSRSELERSKSSNDKAARSVANPAHSPKVAKPRKPVSTTLNILNGILGSIYLWVDPGVVCRAARRRAQRAPCRIFTKLYKKVRIRMMPPFSCEKEALLQK